MKEAYSYPEYCDIAYDWDRRPECDFIEEAIGRYSAIKERSLLDIACGSGIHLREFAARGYEVLGIDESPQMVGFVKKKSAKKNLNIKCARINMVEFRTKRCFGCAICMLDSFRYLLGDEEILRHFKSVASSLKMGTLYIIDLWMPNDRNKIDWEDVSWVQQAGATRVAARYIQHPETFDAVRKTFEDEIIFTVESPGFNSTIRSRKATRILFYDELKSLVSKSGYFDLVGKFYNFDFGLKEGYNIKPLRTIVILKKKEEVCDP